jgi:hypothetical protein
MLFSERKELPSVGKSEKRLTVNCIFYTSDRMNRNVRARQTLDNPEKMRVCIHTSSF